MWHTTDGNRTYEAIADGLGGGMACVWRGGNPLDCVQVYYRRFNTEAKAVTAIRHKAISDGLIEEDPHE